VQPQFVSASSSGNITPSSQFSFEDTSKGPQLSGSQLIERLASLEGRQAGPAISEKRQKFQQRRKEEWRTRTQPVTSDEIQFADG